MRLALGALLVLVGLVFADADLPSERHRSHFFKWNRLRRYQDKEWIRANEHLAKDVKEDYFTQKLCHFNPNVTGTWKQRYWQNDEYYNGNGLQFLNIGGEGEESPTVISYSTLPLVTWAKKLGARLWNLEHRYYGKSRPLPDQSVRNLLFLNSRQALEDLADFIRAKNQELNIKNPKWVVFGGSYPGALALWFREQHPELTVGAVGSSAPVELVVDFFDYLRVCEDSYRTHSQKCADNIQLGFESLHNLLDNKNGRDQIDSVFNLQPPLSQQNLTYTHLQDLYSTIMGNFMVAVQYSRVNAGPFKKGASIPDVCDIMESAAVNPVARLVKVTSYMEQQFGEDSSSTYDSYDSDIKYLQNTSFDAPAAGSRSWIWQTCNEFGYFQSTTYNGIFGSYIPVDFFYNLCTDIFGDKFRVDYIRERVQRSVDNYKRARDYNGTNVVIPNGSLDPWHALGAYVQNNPTAIPYLIQGTAHCADMEPPADYDPDDLKKVRDLIFTKLQEWTGTKASPPAAASRASRHHRESAEKHVEEAAASRSNVEQKQQPTIRARRTKHNGARVCFDCGKLNKKFEPHVPLPARNDEEKRSKKRRHMIAGRPTRGGFLGQLINREKPRVGRESVQYSWIEQPLDHFNDSDTRTYQEQFMSNDRYYKKGGPILLFIGGEGPIDDYWITETDIPFVQWAKKYNGMLYQLEHRYYGDSVPTKDMSLENLKYLTSEQALADAANFIRTMNKQKGYADAKWISYGGSYAGSLSAWFREIYPDDVYAAIGSSGPVEAQVDFYGYMQTVQKDLQEYSKKCGDSLQEAFDKVHELFTTIDGRKTLSEKLSVEPPFKDDFIDPFGTLAFYSDLMGPLMGSVQYNDIYDGVGSICAGLTDRGDIVDRLQEARGYYPVSWDMDEVIEEFKYPGDTRAWFWQTCNEFGFYQATDMGYNAFGSGLPVNFYLRWCTDAYNASLVRDELERNVDATNQRYGGARNYRSSRVIQLYGTVDPWHTLGYYPVNGSHGEDVVSILVNGTSHCSDMNSPDYSGNPAEMKKAIQTVENYLDKWLGK